MGFSFNHSLTLYENPDVIPVVADRFDSLWIFSERWVNNERETHVHVCNQACSQYSALYSLCNELLQLADHTKSQLVHFYLMRSRWNNSWSDNLYKALNLKLRSPKKKATHSQFLMHVIILWMCFIILRVWEEAVSLLQWARACVAGCYGVYPLPLCIGLIA